MKIKLELKRQDLWIGAYWEKKLEITFGDMYIVDVKPYYDVIKTWYCRIWICVAPCLPIHVWWRLK